MLCRGLLDRKFTANVGARRNATNLACSTGVGISGVELNLRSTGAARAWCFKFMFRYCWDGWRDRCVGYFVTALVYHTQIVSLRLHRACDDWRVDT